MSKANNCHSFVRDVTEHGEAHPIRPRAKGVGGNDRPDEDTPEYGCNAKDGANSFRRHACEIELGLARRANVRPEPDDDAP